MKIYLRFLSVVMYNCVTEHNYVHNFPFFIMNYAHGIPYGYKAKEKLSINFD